jgi:PAS domain S-box-containing protein
MSQTAQAQTPAKPASGPNVLQLLAFVFASADVVMDVADGGRVTFATGAAGRLLGRAAETLVGRPWRDFVHDADADLVEAVIGAMRAGERRGPFRIRVIGKGEPLPVMMSLFQMPQRPGVAVALSEIGRAHV